MSILSSSERYLGLGRVRSICIIVGNFIERLRSKRKCSKHKCSIQLGFKQKCFKLSCFKTILFCKTVDNHSSYVQQLAWLVWIRTALTTTQENFDTARADLLIQNSNLFFTYYDGLSALQIRFLKMIADGHMENLNSSVLLRQYEIPSSSNITRLKKSLEQKEIIDINHKKVTFNDPVFLLWFREMIDF